jgi:hypothetical protein
MEPMFDDDFMLFGGMVVAMLLAFWIVLSTGIF